MTSRIEIGLKADRRRLQRWRAAAKKAGRPLDEWAVEVLDRLSHPDAAPFGRCDTCDAQLPRPKPTGRPRRFCPGKRGNNYCRKGRLPPR